MTWLCVNHYRFLISEWTIPLVGSWWWMIQCCSCCLSWYLVIAIFLHHIYGTPNRLHLDACPKLDITWVPFPKNNGKTILHFEWLSSSNEFCVTQTFTINILCGTNLNDLKITIKSCSVQIFKYQIICFSEIYNYIIILYNTKIDLFFELVYWNFRKKCYN